MTLPEIATIEELASFLKVEVKTVYSITRSRNTGPKLASIKVGKQLRFRRAAVEAWLTQQEQGSVSL
jgi:excisionase family DNA binding protein